MKKTSPISVVYRGSDEFAPANIRLGIDSFLLRAGNAPVMEKVIDQVSEEDANEIFEHLTHVGSKVRVHYLHPRLILSFTTTVHEEVGEHIRDLVTVYNLANGGTAQHPLRKQGTAAVTSPGFRADPDLRFASDPNNRFSKSPNVVTEVHFGSNQPIAHFHDRLQNYIVHTNDVMACIGTKIYDRTLTGAFEAVLVIYLRELTTNTPLHFCTVSFGSSPLNGNARIAWTLPAVNGIRGFGIPVPEGQPPYPPCDVDHRDDPVYNVSIPASHALSITEDGTGMPAGLTLVNGGAFNIVLHDFQNAIRLAYEAMDNA